MYRNNEPSWRAADCASRDASRLGGLAQRQAQANGLRGVGGGPACRPAEREVAVYPRAGPAGHEAAGAGRGEEPGAGRARRAGTRKATMCGAMRV